MADFVAPTARAVFLCGHVADAGSGNVHMGWVFDTIRPASYPHAQDDICVVLQLSDGSGEVPVSVNVVFWPEGEAEPEDILQSGSTGVRFTDRIELHRVVLRLSDCVFPQVGLYVIEVYCGEEWVADAPLRVKELLEDSES